MTTPVLMPVINRIPRLFHLLKALGDVMHADLGVSTSMRGVMASLQALGPRTVPELARERPVSRQFMQGVVNELIGGGMAEAVSNPAHLRSSLIALTDKGRATYAAVREREDRLLSASDSAAEPADVQAALRLFDLLERDLAARLAAARQESPHG
jgi:DNA-binding MarR family transcriptional regulator